MGQLVVVATLFWKTKVDPSFLHPLLVWASLYIFEVLQPSVSRAAMNQLSKNILFKL
jgi:hypothetical protein